MLIIKGFATNTFTFNNEPGVVNPVGEISSNSITYAKERGLYKNGLISQTVGFQTFEAQDSGENVELKGSVVDDIIRVCNKVYAYTISKTGVPVTVTEILDHLIESTDLNARNFETGNMVTDGSLYMPEFLSWTTRVNSDDPDFYSVTMWFADASFQNQYPNFEISVIPPIKNEEEIYFMDVFFKTGAEVEDLINSKTWKEMADDMQKERDIYPPTVWRVDTFDYHDPNNPNRIVPTNWGILIYGLNGNNLDAVKDALQDYILSHSRRGREDWVKVLPDIFKRTEFILMPVWDKMAIPDQMSQKGIYSSILFHKEIPAIAKEKIDDYTDAHIDNNVQATGWPYRSLAVVSIGNEENRDAKFRLTDVYPDWIAVPSTSLDFNRMKFNTRTWFEKIQEMIYAAEDFDDYSIPPQDVARVYRYGRLFLSVSVENIHYLVLTKKYYKI